MKLKETYVSFTGLVHVGTMALFIVLDSKEGMNIDIEYIVQQAIHFEHVVFCGDEPMEEREDIHVFIKKVLKLRPDIVIEIRTKGKWRPVGTTEVPSNVHYYVFVPLKKTGIPYEERISIPVLDWYHNAGARFFFEVYTNDDMDEIGLLIQTLGLRKQHIYVCQFSHIDMDSLTWLRMQAKRYGYHIGLDFQQLLWSDEGKHDNQQESVGG